MPGDTVVAVIMSRPGVPAPAVGLTSSVKIVVTTEGSPGACKSAVSRVVR